MSSMSQFTPGVPSIPPIDSALAGYNPMGAFSTDGGASSATLRALGSGAPAAPSSSMPGVGSNMGPLAAVKAAGAGAGGPESAFSKLLGNVGTGVGIFADLAGIWQGFQQQKLAKQQYGTNLAFANANLENTVKDYNNRYSSLLTARGFTQGDAPATTQQAITSGSLNFKPIKG